MTNGQVILYIKSYLHYLEYQIIVFNRFYIA